MANTYPPELKAQVIAEHVLGDSYNTLARRHNVPKATIQHWLTDRPVSPMVIPEKDELGAMVYEYLKAGLGALIAQANAAATPDVIRGQGQSLYLLHGTLADKIVLILRGIEAGAAANDEQASLAGGASAGG